MRRSALGLAGTALWGSGACSRRDGRPRRVIRRTLGRTGLQVPVVSMGSVYAINLVRAALDRGITYIHTSSGYGERQHERMLGEIFRDRPRDGFVLGTSPDLPYRTVHGSGRSRDVGRGVDPQVIARSMEESLRRLGLAHVDIYYLASVGSREAALHEPYLQAFSRLKAEGKTRWLGIATHENEPAVIRAAIESGVWDVVLTAYNFRQTHRQEIGSAIREAAAAGLGVVAMKTQAGVYWDRRRLRKINMRAALKWVLANESVHTTIPAFSTFEEMEEDLSIMEDLDLSPGEREDLAWGVERGEPGNLCQQCGSCRRACPAGEDIPTLMRAHMYAFAHGRPARSRPVLTRWSAAEVACAGCRTCEVACPLGLDVRTRALEISRMLKETGPPMAAWRRQPGEGRVNPVPPTEV